MNYPNLRGLWSSIKKKEKFMKLSFKCDDRNYILYKI